MKGIIKKHIGHIGFITYYIDINGDRFWYVRAHRRTTFWRSIERGKEIKVLIYPCWPFLDRYINKKVTVIL